MTFSYKVRVLALLLSLVHSSYGAWFARPPPPETYCKSGTCAVFHPPINKSHTICMWVPKGTNVTNHVHNVNPDEICGLQGLSGFPNDTHGSWGGNGNRDSFCADLEVLKTNVSYFNQSYLDCHEIMCTQTNAYLCTVKRGCHYNLTLPHDDTMFKGYLDGVDFSRKGYPLNPNIFSPENTSDNNLSLDKRWKKHVSGIGDPAGKAKDKNGKKDGDKGTNSGATGEGKGAATSNTNQWFGLLREFIHEHISPLFGNVSEHMPDVDTVGSQFSWIYTSVTGFFEQLVMQQFKEFINQWYNMMSLYSTRNEMQVTTFFMFIWGIFSLCRYFTAHHSKFTKVIFGSKHFIAQGKLQNIMITKKAKDGIRNILCMCKVIHDDVSDDAEVAGRSYKYIPVLVHSLETCTWNWIWYEWKLFLPYLITYPLIGFGWSLLFLQMLHKVFGWKLIFTILGVIEVAMTGLLVGPCSFLCVILLVWSFLRTILWNLCCKLWTWLKHLCTTIITQDTPPFAFQYKAEGLFHDMTCICKQYLDTPPGRFIFDTSTSVIRIFGYPEVWLCWFVGTLLFPTNLHSQMIPVALGQTEEWDALRVTYIPNDDSYHHMLASGKCGTSPKSMPYVLELCMCICMLLNYRKYHITPSSAICIVDCCFVLFHGVLCIYIPWSFFGSSFVSTVFFKYSNPFVFFGTIATGMGQMTHDFLLRSFLPNFMLVKGLHLYWLDPVVRVAGIATITVNAMATLCFWHSIPEFWWVTSVVVIGVCLWLQLPKDANARHIYFDAFWKVINPINHHGAMARIVLFIMVIQIMVRLYPIAVVQEWVNAPDMCLEYETIDKISKKQGFSEYIISIMNLSRDLCMLHTAAQTYFYFKPTNFKIKRETISKVTIKGVAHVFEGTMQFRWTSMCAKNDLHRLYLCLLSFMIWLGWWLWPGPEADESDWYTAHLKMYIYGPLEYILVCLCECVWKDKSLIEKPEFSLMLQVLAFVCCLWLLYFADIKSSPCTHTTFQTNSSKQIAVAINNGILDIWGVVFNSIMSEDVPSAYEHREHGVAMTFDVSEGIYELVPHGAEVAWTSYDRVEIFGGPGLNDALYGSRTRESDAAKKHGLKARGRGLTAAEKK